MVVMKFGKTKFFYESKEMPWWYKMYHLGVMIIGMGMVWNAFLFIRELHDIVSPMIYSSLVVCFAIAFLMCIEQIVGCIDWERFGVKL